MSKPESLDSVLVKAKTGLGEIFDYLDGLYSDGRCNTKDAAVSFVTGRFQISRIYAREVVNIWRPEE